MNYARLKAFHAVTSEGSFTKAARLLGVSQPAVSFQVKALEEAYGVTLFDRRGRRVVPTELGSTLLGLTRRLFSVEEEVREVLAAAQELKHGRLRLGADGPYHVTRLLAAFSRRYPGLSVSLAIGNSDEVLQHLVDYRTDVAVLARLEDDPRLHAISLGRHRLVVFVRRSHPWARRNSVRLQDLEGQRMVLREVGSVTRRVFEEGLDKAGVTPRVVMEIESREAVREVVAAGLGIGVVSEAEFGGDRRLKALPVSDVRLENSEYVVCLKDRRKLRVVSAFLDIVEEFLAANRA